MAAELFLCKSNLHSTQKHLTFATLNNIKNERANDGGKWGKKWNFVGNFMRLSNFITKHNERQHTVRMNGALVTERQANNAHTLWLKLDIFCVMQRGQNVFFFFSLISPTQTSFTVGCCSSSRLCNTFFYCCQHLIKKFLNKFWFFSNDSQQNFMEPVVKENITMINIVALWVLNSLNYCFSQFPIQSKCQKIISREHFVVYWKYARKSFCILTRYFIGELKLW